MKRLSILFLLILAASFAAAQNAPSGPQCTGQITIGACALSATGITVSFNPASVAVGQTATVQALLQVGTAPNTDITRQCAWSVDNTAIATIAFPNPPGIWTATGVSAGTANFTCTYGSLTGTGAFGVAAPPIITNPNAATCATPCPLPSATQNVAYSFTFAASGGVLPYTWSNSVGSPPTGLTLSGAGVLSGTPTVAGTTTWTVQVTDNIAEVKTLQVSLAVTAAAACGAPPNYCSRQDTTANSGASFNGGNPPANLVGLNCPDAGVCANAFWLDDNNSGPAQGYVWRLTDHTMVGANAGVDWTITTPSSSTQRNWAANTADPHVVEFSYSKQSAQAFFAISAGTPPTHVAKGNAIQDKNGFSFGGIEFSATIQAPTTNLLFYSCGSNPAAFPTKNLLAKYILDETNAAWTASTGLGQNLAAAITATTLLDPQTVPGLVNFMTDQTGPHWNRWMAAGCADISADRTDHWAAIDYRYAQDRGSLITMWNQATNCARWMDIHTGQVGGTNGCGPVGPTSGFGPLPPPLAPTMTLATTGGSLNCAHTYTIGLTYAIKGGGNDNTAGETTIGTTANVGPNGSGTSCLISVTPPVSNPGGGSGNNLSLTATHYNAYACDQSGGSCGSSGATNPATVGVGSSNIPGGLAWQNPNNITTSGSTTFAQIQENGQCCASNSQNLIGSGFGFSVPSTATITGIQVQFDRWLSSTDGGTVFAHTVATQMMKAGTASGAAKGPGANWTNTTPATETWGSSTDLWGGTWTPADINNSLFGFEAQANLDTTGSNHLGTFFARVNNYKITVFYTGGSQTLTLQTNNNNANPGPLARPSIASVATCSTGTSSNTVTYWLYSSNGSGTSLATSVPSAPSSLTVTSNTAPGCTITVTSLDPNATKYWVSRDDPSIMVCNFTPPATSCRDNNQNPTQWANQSTPIGTTLQIASITTTTLSSPTVNQAGPLIHNFRMDPITGTVVMTTTNGYQNTQGSPANAPFELYWNPAGTTIIASNPQVQPCPPYASYASGHWTHVPYLGFGAINSWVQGVRDEGIITYPLSATDCSGLNYVFLNQANAGTDTQSGDQHLSGNFPPIIFRDAYPLTNPFNLPSVAYDGEITFWQLPVAITSVSRAGCPGACVVTVTTSGAHNLQNNVNVYINNVTDTSYNGAVNGAVASQNLTVTGSTTFTFTQTTGTNGSSSGGWVDRPMGRSYHTWDAAQAYAGVGSNFNSTPRGSISQDGLYFCNVTDAMRNSNNAQGTAVASLGSNTGGATCTPGSGGNCRYDIMCGQVK